MDRTGIKKALGWTKLRSGRRVQGRRLKIHVASLNKNFYLKNPTGHQLSTAMLVRFAYDGVTTGWKKDAEVWPRDVYLLELNLMMLAQSRQVFSN